MHTSIVRFLVVIIVVAACGPSTPPSSEAAADSLRALDQQLQEAVARKDLESIVSFYDDDALMLPAAEPAIRGKPAIRAEWAHILAIPGFENQSKLLTLDLSTSGDLAYTTGSYSSLMVGEDDAVVQEPGKWVSIWKRRQGGAWRIVVDTYNTDIPPPDHK